MLTSIFLCTICIPNIKKTVNLFDWPHSRLTIVHIRTTACKAISIRFLNHKSVTGPIKLTYGTMDGSVFLLLFSPEFVWFSFV